MGRGHAVNCYILQQFEEPQTSAVSKTANQFLEYSQSRYAVSMSKITSSDLQELVAGIAVIVHVFKTIRKEDA
jgi:hypothetical protein